MCSIPSPVKVTRLWVILKFAAASRRRTCCKSACFHREANLEPLCHPLQVTIRFLQLPLPPPRCPALALGLPMPCDIGVSGVYLVSSYVQIGGYRSVGVRDFLSAEDFCGSKSPCMTVDSKSRAFWPWLLTLLRETGVSHSIVSTVHAKVHMCFPCPFLWQPVHFLFVNLGQAHACLMHQGCRLFTRGSAHPSYPGCTHDQRHPASRVVLVENKT